MNKVIVALVISLVMISSIFASQLTEIEKIMQEIDSEFLEINFDPSRAQQDTEENDPTNINSQVQEINFDPSKAQQDIEEELMDDVTLTQNIQESSIISNGEENLDNGQNPPTIVEYQEDTQNIVFIAGFGIIVISLIGITILYSIHHFRRKREFE